MTLRLADQGLGAASATAHNAEADFGIEKLTLVERGDTDSSHWPGGVPFSGQVSGRWPRGSAVNFG